MKGILLNLFINAVEFLIKKFQKEGKKEVKNVEIVEKEITEVTETTEPIIQPIIITEQPRQETPIIPPFPKKEWGIIKSWLLPNQYVQDSDFTPNQIYLHHTAGGTAESTIRYWSSNKERVCTHFIIDRDGKTYQTIPLEKSWGFHLYVSSPGNKINRKFKIDSKKYDKQSIGIELCNYGYVTKFEDKFLNCYGKVINPKDVVKLDKPYQGYEYWEKYTDAQLNSLQHLLNFLLEQYPKIKSSLQKDHRNIFNINQNALNFVPGIYSHTSVRTDKFDCYPYPNLITMLNNLV